MESGCHGRRGAASQGERGRGDQVWGGRGGVAAKKGQKGERATTRVSLREKRNDATDDFDLASNGPQPFSHIHAPKINLLQYFFGILHIPYKTIECMYTVYVKTKKEKNSALDSMVS
jgi:hypothetical protein